MLKWLSCASGGQLEDCMNRGTNARDTYLTIDILRDVLAEVGVMLPLRAG